MREGTRIYLDHAATCPLVLEAEQAMAPWLDCGNPSSLYAEGRRAKAAIDAAREQISGALGCLFAEAIFTGSGTEAAVTALVGTALANHDSQRHRVLIGAAEHHCVLHTQAILERLGYQVEWIPVDHQGRANVASLEPMLLDTSVLAVSVMHANNELGTINDIAVLSGKVHEVGAVLHVDCVQTFRAIPWSVDTLGADLISISAHKIGGPKGVGCLYIRAGTSVAPIVAGGGQERELRGGTENVAAIVGFGAAVAATDYWSSSEPRSRFEELLVQGGAVPTVSDATRLAGHCHVRFPGINAETLLIRLDRAGISASSGAACSSGSVEPSHVLQACGYGAAEAKEGVRFTFGKKDSVELAERAAAIVLDCVENVRTAAR